MYSIKYFDDKYNEKKFAREEFDDDVTFPELSVALMSAADPFPGGIEYEYFELWHSSKRNPLLKFRKGEPIDPKVDSILWDILS